MNSMTFRNADNFGLQLENLVFMHLRRAAHEIEYVSTENGRGTDFLARNRTTGDLNLIQVSWDMSEPQTLPYT
jgi:uncharacterized protein